MMGGMGRKGQHPYYGTSEETWAAQSSTTSINPWLVVGFAVMVFVVAIAALVVVVTRDTTDGELVADKTSTTSTVTATPPTSPPVTVPPTVATVTIAVTQPPVTVAPTAPPTTQGPYMNEADALYRLQSMLDQDRDSAEQLVGMWVPQVSSKKVGLDVKNDDRGAYTAAMVLSDHLAYEERYEPEGTEVLVIRSDDFNFKVPGFLVTVIGRPFMTPEEANGWCNDRNIGVDDCFAKRLDHDGDWKGSVLGRK